MYLNRLNILNFKNISHCELSLSAGINCFTGDNGAGKTNIVDAVYYLSMCKSALSMTDGQSVRHGEEFFMLEGEYATDDGRGERVACSFARRGESSGKVVKRNGKEYDRLADHIGLIPVVIVSPADTFLVTEVEERRRWLNAFLSQLDRSYLEAVVRYNKVLGERNRVLKSPALSPDLLEVYDERLAAHASIVHEHRAKLVGRLQPLVERYYAALSEERESVELTYRSDLNDSDMATLLHNALQRDTVNQYTTVGVHRDDIVMKIGDYPLRKFGSQGQQKSFLIALKLAQYTLLAEHCGNKPLLLLDDLFDKLDMGRVEQLISLVEGEKFGQIFITDCNKVRLRNILDRRVESYALFRVRDGEIAEDDD